MTDKSGGDALQANQGSQASLNTQDLNSIAAAGVGILEAMGGSANAMGEAQQAVNQAQTQANIAATGDGGDDNINANTTINIS